MTTLAPAPRPGTPAASPATTRARTRQQARRRAVRVDLLPARRPAPVRRAGAAGLRVAAFPLVVLAVLVGGGWQVGRSVAAAQPLTTTVTSPAVTASWGRLVVLGASQYDRPAAAAAGDVVVVDVVVRLVPTGGSGRFDPASVVLRRPDGREVAATLGALAPVRVPADGSVEGRLGFVTAPFDGTPVLVVRDGGAPGKVVTLRPARHAGPAPVDAREPWVRDR